MEVRIYNWEQLEICTDKISKVQLKPEKLEFNEVPWRSDFIAMPKVKFLMKEVEAYFYEKDSRKCKRQN